MTPTKVADMTVQQLREFIKEVVREEEQTLPSGVKMPPMPTTSPFDIKPITLPPNHPALQILSREDM
jgi:hypothetical protein